MAKKIILVRHAHRNALDLTQNDELSEKGRQQAQAFASDEWTVKRAVTTSGASEQSETQVPADTCSLSSGTWSGRGRSIGAR